MRCRASSCGRWPRIAMPKRSKRPKSGNHSEETMERTQILEEISKMTVLELSQLIKDMEEKFGVSAAAAVAVAGPAAGPAAAAAEEKTEFTVMLTAVGDNKVNVIKA